MTIKDGHVYEYTIEPSEYEIDTIVQIDIKTLGIKIKSNFKSNFMFKVEILNFNEKLVKWSLSGEPFKAKPYDEICDRKEEKINKESRFDEKWDGLYYFYTSKEGEDWREGKSYDLNISLDSVNLRSYGYQHLRDRKCYAIQKEDSLFVYSQEKEEGLLLKLFIKNDEYMVSFLVDRKGEYKVEKKN